MNLLNKILAWTQTLPSWQQDAARRLFFKDKLSEDDYKHLYILLKSHYGLPKPDNLQSEPLNRDHLPIDAQDGQNIILDSIGMLNHVNRIAPDQTLTFSRVGMTIIYGDNGSGKSGYVRVIKNACRSRDQSETVHPDANNANSIHEKPTAIFKIKIGDKSEEIKWAKDVVPDERLSSISVFDSRCARSYITDKQTIAYLPYGLDIVEKMARDVIPNLKGRLIQEIKSIDTNTSDFNHFDSCTKVGELISKLSASTDLDTVKKLSTLSEEEEKRIEDLNKVLANDNPVDKEREIKRFVARLETTAENVNSCTNKVNDGAIKSARNIHNEKIKAELAENSAASLLQGDEEELLPGTGGPLWKSLFEAARKYSTEVAYPKHKFPYSGDGALCLLCQTPLNAAGERLERFEKYIKDDVAKTANEKRAALDNTIKEIKDFDSTIVQDSELLDEIRQRNENIARDITKFQESINERKDWLLRTLENNTLENNTWDNLPKLESNLYQDLCNFRDEKLHEAYMYKKAANTENKEKLQKELKELKARQELKKLYGPIRDLIERMSKVEQLKKWKNDLNTQHISIKSKEFASEVVTDLKAKLDIEFCNLGINNIKTKLEEKSVKGKTLYQLLLEVPAKYKTDEILSEGEQRAIAISSFLAELSSANHPCGIVLDDPVSSLDHQYRLRVAKRLAEESEKRQVIIFTHDSSFLADLKDCCDKQNLQKKELHLEWNDDGYAGKIFDNLPWEHETYENRIKILESKCCEFEKSEKQSRYPSKQYKDNMRDAYSGLRETLERAVQDKILGQTIRRYHGWIRISRLKQVIGFNREGYVKISQLYKDCSNVMRGHDSSSDRNQPPPNSQDLMKDIERLKDIVEYCSTCNNKAIRKAKTTKQVN